MGATGSRAGRLLRWFCGTEETFIDVTWRPLLVVCGRAPLKQNVLPGDRSCTERATWSAESRELIVRRFGWRRPWKNSWDCRDLTSWLAWNNTMTNKQRKRIFFFFALKFLKMVLQNCLFCSASPHTYKINYGLKTLLRRPCITRVIIKRLHFFLFLLAKNVLSEAQNLPTFY